MTGVTLDNCDKLYLRQIPPSSLEGTVLNFDGPRWLWAHASVLVGHYIFISGGYDSGAKALGYFYTLNIITWKWRQIDIDQAYLAVAQHLAFLVGDKVMLTSGASAEYRDVGRHTWRFDLVSEEVVTLECPTGRLVPQYKSAGEYLEKLGLIVLFGGTVGIELSNRVVGYDVESDAWRVIRTKGTRPVPRYGHSSCLHGAFDIFFFGGTDTHKKERFPGITHLRYSHGQFMWIETRWTPSPASFARSTITCTGDRIYIFGGSVGAMSRQYMYAYDMKKDYGTQLLGEDLQTFARPGIVSLDGTGPPFAHHSAVQANDRMVIIGGIKRNPENVYVLTPHDPKTLS